MQGSLKEEVGEGFSYRKVVGGKVGKRMENHSENMEIRIVNVSSSVFMNVGTIGYWLEKYLGKY